MAWQTVTKGRGRGRWDRYGDTDRQQELRELAQELKKELFKAPPRGSGASRREEWVCPTCSTSNFMDRRQCRQCVRASRTASGHPPRSLQPSSASQPSLQGAAPAEASADKLVTDQRRVPPEKRVAEAEARAASLESAAATFRQGGLECRAKELEEEAAAIRKKEAHAPPPGCRLDMAIGYVERAERRALKADEVVKAAEKALAEAVEARDAANKAVADGKDELAQLRAGLASTAGDAANASAAAAADAEAVAVGAQASDALARARSAVESAEAAPLTLSVFRLPEALGTTVFAGRTVPALDAPLDLATAFFLQDTLQSRVRDAAVAGARAAAAAATAAAPAAPA